MPGMPARGALTTLKGSTLTANGALSHSERQLLLQRSACSGFSFQRGCMSELMSKECEGTPVGCVLQNPAVLTHSDGAGDPQGLLRGASWPRTVR